MENNPIVIETKIVNEQSQIRNLAARIQETKNGIKNLREMQENILTSDSAYNEIDEQAKTANRDKKFMKVKLLDNPNGLNLNIRIEDAKLELKELNESLSTVLEVYVAKTGSVHIKNEIGGTEIDIVKKFTIKPSQLKLFY
jgi:hypothetical protein